MSRRRKALLVAASVIAVSCPMVVRFHISHAVLPHLEGSFAVAKSGNGGDAGGNGAGNHGGGGNGRDDSASNPGERNNYGNSGGDGRSGHGPSGREAGGANKDSIPGVRDIGPKRTGSAQRLAADRGRVLDGPAQGQRPTPFGKARDMRVNPQRAKYTLVASGLTDANLTKLMERGFRIQARTKGSLSPRTIQLLPPHGLSVEQARRAVRRINIKAVVDFDTYYYTDGESPEGFLTGYRCINLGRIARSGSSRIRSRVPVQAPSLPG